MARLNSSILDDVREACGVVQGYDIFDNQLINDINSAFSTLHQLGYGPVGGFSIDDSTTKWNELIKSNRFNFIKQYVIMKVHLMFDPPTSSIAVNQLNKEIEEYEWRIRSEVECYGEEDSP